MLTSYARLAIEDEFLAVYEYSGYDSLYDFDSSKVQSYDGSFIIKKSSLEEPDIHEKYKKNSKGKKVLSVKRITHIVDVAEKLHRKDVVVDKECRNAFRHRNHPDLPCDFMAYELIHKVYLEYQKNGTLPTEVSYLLTEG